MKKLHYIDGLRGIGALMVYLCHFVFAFYYGAYSLQPEHVHTASGLEILIGKSPLNLFYNGNFAVELFLVLSGFVLCLGYFSTGDRNRLRKGAAGRYFRLMPPVLLVNLLVWGLMRLGAYQNSLAAEAALSMDWFYGFNHFPPDLGEALVESLAGCFLWGSNAYNGVLWTMPYLFLGAWVVYLAAALVGENPLRYVAYVVMMATALVTNIYFTGVFFGFFVCDLVCTRTKWLSWYRKRQWLSWLFFLSGVYLASYPSIGTDMGGTIYAVLGVPRVVPYHLAGAGLILLGAVGNSFWQRVLGFKPLRFLGKISYSLYLIHFPVIATFSSWFFLKLQGKLGYHWTVGLDFILTTLLVLALSAAGQRYVEPLGNQMAQGLQRMMGKKTGRR
ncbi:MAG: acyltransferase [Lachnospiraceae bacterium]|jgi:peptidoglycan/LPS O-acetylase OafA/YrhL|nr:acyltransferase [Lachnospiraceae bacterium]MCI8994611.1 acyltransferase [Lachnospiraceae bacterium]